MSEQMNFELELSAAVKVFAANADSPFEASRVAASALTDASNGWPSWRSSLGSRPIFTPLFAVAAFVALAAIGIVIYVNRPGINVGPPAPTERPSANPTTASTANVAPTLAPTSRPEGIFADVGGWIAMGSADGIWAVDRTQRGTPDGRVRLTAEQGTPKAWSPEASKLLFLRSLGDAEDLDQINLFVLNADGTETRLARAGDRSGAGFTPGGSQVVYGDGSNIYVISAEGGTPELLLTGDPEGWWTLSPDGTQMAYLDWGHGDSGHSLSVMNTDGTGTRVVTDDPRIMGPSHLRGHAVVWSPDGQHLTFATEYVGVWVVAIDGSGLRRLSSEESQVAFQGGGVPLSGR